MTAVSELPSPRSGEHTLAVAVGLVSFVALYLTSGAIDNDHFVIYARAMQVLGGDWPTAAPRLDRICDRTSERRTRK